MSGSTFGVYGLDDLGRSLHDLSRDLEDELEKADEAAAEKAASGARSAAGARGGVAGHVAPSITAEGRTVGLGGSAYPMAMGAEKGANAYPQFPPYLGAEDGYFVAPTIDDQEDDRADLYDQALESALKRSNLA